MTGPAALAVGGASLAAAVDWWAVWTDRDRVEQLAKPAVMVALLGAVLVSDLQGWARGWMVVALAAGLAGDVFLLPAIDAFVAGLGSFLVGHLAYMALAAVVGIEGGWLAGGLVLATGLVATVGTTIVEAVRPSRLAGPVTSYVVVLGLSTAMLVGTGSALLASGACLFATSDALLGWDRFVAQRPDGRVAIHATYQLAQLLLTVGAITS